MLHRFWILLLNKRETVNGVVSNDSAITYK